ncbi:MAG: RidA family protein [Candidatus Poseidoniaceae archaeon]
MAKEEITIDGAKKYGPYSAGIRSSGVIWLSGQIDPDAGDVIAQAKGSMAKIDELLDAASIGHDNICFVQILLADINDFAAVNEVYSAWLSEVEIKPARAAFQAGALPAGAAIEIVVQAME